MKRDIHARFGNILLIMVLAQVGFGVGCADHSSDQIVLRWVTDPSPAREKQLEGFHKLHPNIRIHLDWGSGTSMAKVLVQIAAHAGPDLIDLYFEEQVRYFTEHNALLPITNLCEESGISLDEFWPQCQVWMVQNGEIYGIPPNAGTMVLFYNKDHFDEAGLTYPDASWNWETYLEAAKKLTIRSQDGRRVERFGMYPSMYEHLLWQAGGDFWTPDMQASALDSEAALKAAAFAYNIRHKWKVAPTALDEQNFSIGGWGGGGINLFANGKVSMLETGRWAIVTFRRYSQSAVKPGERYLRYGIAPIPGEATKAALFMTKITTINRDCKHPREAFEFLKYLTTPQFSKLIIEGGDGLPAVKALAKSDLFLSDPNYPDEKENHVYLETIPMGRVMRISPYVVPAEFQNIRDDYYQMLDAGEVKPENFCRELSSKTNEAIQRYKKKKGL